MRLSDFRGRSKVVLFFYPKDNSPICSLEACSFRDSYEVFREAGAEVIGISAGLVPIARAIRRAVSAAVFTLERHEKAMCGGYSALPKLWAFFRAGART